MKKKTLEEHIISESKKHGADLKGEALVKFEDENPDYGACARHLKYVPFINSCPMRGGRCLRKDCPYKFYSTKPTKYKDSIIKGRCLEFEVRRMWYQALGQLDKPYFFNEEDGHSIWYIDVRFYPKKEGENQKEQVIVIRPQTFGDGDNETLWWVLRDLKISKHFKTRRFDSPAIIIPGTFKNLHRLRETINWIKGYAGWIGPKLKEYETCFKCGNYNQSFTKSPKGRIVLCDDCQNELISMEFKAEYERRKSIRKLRGRKRKTHMATNIRKMDDGTGRKAAYLCDPHGPGNMVISNKTARELNRITDNKKEVTCGNCRRIMEAKK